MKKNRRSKSRKFNLGFATFVIPVALIVAIVIFKFIMGNPANFQGNDPANAALPGNFYGIIYKGGFIVPILMTLLLTVITFVIERFIAINKATGTGNVADFVQIVKDDLKKNEIDGAMTECDVQKGSVANVIKTVLLRYRTLEKDTTMAKDQKLSALQSEVEESTSLELPALEENLVFLAVITSLGTLMGLLGTVLGMIRAFAALANAGAPDSVALAQGISEALVNTAFGIGTAAFALIFYNFFTTKIDKLTYSIDEAGFSLVQTYAANHA
ncbi:MAG TPA: MotA/TolQ/ExbB proton channel family protein [Bacteroidales bacterium]|nr:MotA/TolQ/ExbB proton channel family protein [Bacteroidales bacterium]HPT01520.1 MotA/TolQ/ExbB proton channel family protein [Bacteroidales bacterium]